MTFEEAQRLCNIAFSPQSGEPQLCFRGRIARARHIIATTRDGDKRNNLELGIEMLRKMQGEAARAATSAASLWASTNLDRDSNEVYPPACQCEGCQIAELQTQAADALAKAGQHFHNLIVPPIDTNPIQPLLLDPKQEAKSLEETRAWIAALREYEAAKNALGEHIDWASIYGGKKYIE